MATSVVTVVVQMTMEAQVALADSGARHLAELAVVVQTADLLSG